MTGNNRRNLKILGCLAAVIILIIFGISALKKHAYYLRTVRLETSEIGRILCLFVEDEGRLPKSMEELIKKDYLHRNNKTINSNHKLTRTPEGVSVTMGHPGIALENLDIIIIRYHGDKIGTPIIWIKNSGIESAIIEAKYCSKLIELKLLDAKKDSATSTSSPNNDSEE